jgi:hypothetical protein
VLPDTIVALESAVGQLLLAGAEEGINSSAFAAGMDLLMRCFGDVQEARKYVADIQRHGQPGLWVLEGAG